MAEIAPFSRSVRVETVPEGGVEHVLEANEAERRALAELNGLPAIARLTAKFALHRAGRGMIRVRGDVHAQVTQTCVVSLEPFDIVLDEPVEVRFAASAGESTSRRGPPASTAESGAFAIGEEDEPDPVIDGKIDLGALAAEFMILGLDPYPRKPGVDFIPASSQEDIIPASSQEDISPSTNTPVKKTERPN
jgi:Large ribosomal RNA subunit accumulation protein YceD